MNLNWDLFRWHYPKKFRNHFLLKSADDLTIFYPPALIFSSPPSTPTWHADAREFSVIYGTAIPHSFQEDDVAASSIIPEAPAAPAVQVIDPTTTIAAPVEEETETTTLVNLLAISEVPSESDTTPSEIL